MKPAVPKVTFVVKHFRFDFEPAKHEGGTKLMIILSKDFSMKN